MKLSCSAATPSSCRFAVALTVEQRGRAVTIARHEGALPSEQKITVRLEPDAKVLARNRKLSASLVVTELHRGVPGVVVYRQQLQI